ncbi:MAG: transcription-repair coupling factor, partial [Oscillospiraceae bacterium]|nr:transcription-repair coupling factor [Oscillospiraceae bacterium]
LTAIKEYVEFGSGFKIAMRDLEIRGAGNLLGPEQSGYMMSVGYDMYLQLLEEAVLEERGEGKKKPRECTADLTVSANIPEPYIPSAEQRMDVYRRIAAIRSQDGAQDVLDELMDRYGDPPSSVLALLDIALLRSEAATLGVQDITQRGETLHFTFGEAMPVEAVMKLCTGAKYRRRVTLRGGNSPVLELRLQKESVLDTALRLIEDIRLYEAENTETTGEKTT